MELNVHCHLIEDPDGDERRIWEGVRVDCVCSTDIADWSRYPFVSAEARAAEKER